MGNWDGRSSSNRFRGNRSHGSRGRRRSHTPFKTRFYRATHGDFNPSFGKSIGIIGLILLSITSLVVLNQNWHLIGFSKGNNGGNGTDPTNSIAQLDDAHLTGWNNILASVGGGQLNLNPNSSTPAMAIFKSSIDLSSANSRELAVLAESKFSSCCVDTAWYLTKSSALPTSNINSYNPKNDPNVMLEMLLHPTGGGFADFILFENTNITSTTNTIGSEDYGSCAIGSSCMMTVNTAVATANTMYLALNYSGANGPGSGTQNGASCMAVGNVAGASNQCGIGLDFGSLTVNFAGQTNARSQSYPRLDLGTKYYVGLWAAGGSAVTVGYLGFSSVQAISFYNFLPAATAALPPQPIQPSGFFAPIINFFLTGAVYVFQALLGFFQWLFNILSALMSTAISSLSGVMVAIFNAIGGVFGYNTLGSQLVGLVADFGSFLTNSFRNLTGIVSNIVTFINNAATFITNFFTNNSFTTLLFAEIGALPNVWTVLNGIWADFAKWFIAGTLSVVAILEIDWVLGTLWTAVEGWKGFREWLDVNELIILKLFQIAYWMFELGLDVAFKLIMIIKGRVLWFQVAAEG